MYNPKTIEVFCFLLAVSLIVKFFFLRPVQILSGLKGSLFISALDTRGVLLSRQGMLGSTGKLEYIGPILLLSVCLFVFVFCFVSVSSHM